MLSAIYTMGAIGLVSGLLLAFASKIFYVYVDPKVLAVDDALPGANCGGCGMPGCGANAEAIVAGKAAPNSCVAGSAELVDIIAEILGVTVEAKEPDIALPDCTYGSQDADIKYAYDGINDCRAAMLLGGGMKVCNIGCLGFGTCAKACPFGAITMGEDNLPVVDKELCTGCGTCERVCPKNIIKLSSVTRRILKEYTTEDCTTPCQRNCPAGINIREYIKQISLGDYHRAVRVIKERVPFPTVIGRICPRPCENDCRRKYIDEPVAINALKRFVADFENNNERILPFKAPETGRKIAVVGGGVEGLSAAFFSARLGHSPTVFEATPKLGGLLRTAIARNRLPLSILDWDIEGILETGVTADTGKKIGRDFTIDSLLEDDFEAVFLASGGWDNRMCRDSGYKIDRTLPGLYLLIDLLNSMPENHNGMSCGAHAVIAGGENLAAVAINKCKEAGAEKITFVSREKETSASFGGGDLNVFKEEGINIIYNSAITRFLGKGPDLLWVEYTDLVNGSKTVMPANTLFLASGRFPELIFHKPESKEGNDYKDSPEEPVAWEAIPPYKQSAFSKETGLLSEGDPLTDISAAVKAIGAGRRGATSMHYIMYGMDLNVPEYVVTPLSVIQNVSSLEDVMSSPRSIMPLGTINDEELEQGFKETTARKEAGRCLRCGLICYRKKV
jgi:formate dehydrogenase beta subunit